MLNELLRQEVPLTIAGLGIVFYSPFAVAAIAEGEDYLATKFLNPDNVAAHAMRGDIASFCTGSGGVYKLVVYCGALDEHDLQAADFKLRLCLEVRDGDVYFRDLYDLMDWTADCPSSQRIKLQDGFYRVTAYSSAPESGIIGRDQTIYLHFEKLDQRPTLEWEGVPQLC